MAQHKPLPARGQSAWLIRYVLDMFRTFDMDHSRGGIFAYVYKADKRIEAIAKRVRPAERIRRNERERREVRKKRRGKRGRKRRRKEEEKGRKRRRKEEGKKKEKEKKVKRKEKGGLCSFKKRR